MFANMFEYKYNLLSIFLSLMHSLCNRASRELLKGCICTPFYNAPETRLIWNTLEIIILIFIFSDIELIKRILFLKN
ncbi:MAG: hypothetical protein APF76_09230 [Desulfitibacter sp. BRH_c19]|nr:MAG: hypothetical protein APF76_09230 [Desulfitibacter sp. BRH_c19]